MGRVEKMLLNFCWQNWISEDEMTRHRIARKNPQVLVPLRRPHGIGVWRSFYKRHPAAMHHAKGWSRTVHIFMGQIEAEEATLAASDAIDSILRNATEKGVHP